METPHLNNTIKYLKEFISYEDKESIYPDIDPTKEKLEEYEAIKEALSIHNVSQQRELLIDYMKWFDDNRDMYYEVSNKEMIDEYIKSINCG